MVMHPQPSPLSLPQAYWVLKKKAKKFFILKNKTKKNVIDHLMRLSEIYIWNVNLCIWCWVLQTARTVDVYTGKRESIEGIGSCNMEAGRVEIFREDWSLKTQRRAMLKFESKAIWVQNSFFLGDLSLFSKTIS